MTTKEELEDLRKTYSIVMAALHEMNAKLHELKYENEDLKKRLEEEQDE
tara:strand:+ start:215 stop:361 length:147 start_codon:yes stop_codon:yes gene_type:complete